MNKGSEVKRCKNCGHLLQLTDKGLKHKQSNHSFYCPCRKPTPGWQGHYL